MAKETVSTSAVRRSTIMGLVLFGIFGLLLLRILIIQTVSFDKYQSKVINQMTTESPVSADRGKIYDRNGNVLATNITTYRIFISPSGIKNATQPEGSEGYVDYPALVSKGLSEILGVEYDFVYKQATGYTQYLDRTIQRKVKEEVADTVRKYIAEHELEDMIYLEAQSTRYYPGDTLGSHMIGFTSSDGVGLYGLEYQYDEYLRGTDGYYILARDSYGNEMPYEYASYIDAIDGYNLSTTIDASVQGYLEEQLAKTVADHDVKNRATGIVMDVNTGAILAMATSSPFDLNDPWALTPDAQAKLDKSGLSEGSDEYNALLSKTLTETWSNKAVAESYIPGSTFKIITSAMALEEKQVSMVETVDCPGYKKVLGIAIHCHKVNGHGGLSFAQGLQQSCNVWFMTLGGRVGIDNFVQYTKAFGYREKTGIDLPGEGNSIFISEMSELDLAIYAFGQNFNVTPIQHITAISSVANGGSLMTPYVVEKVTDNSGNVIYQHSSELKRQTLSEDVCKTISQILEEGVSGDGGAKNAYVAGYKVAAKTGTSEKKDAGKEEMYICSTVAYAPADDPQVAIIIIVDEPTKGTLYGSTVAAPYVAAALEKILPQMGITAEYTESELKRLAVRVGSYTSWSVERAIEAIEEKGLKYEVVGNGDTVVAQYPKSGVYVENTSPAIGKVFLYTDKAEIEKDMVTVPDFTKMTPRAANGEIIRLGLNIKIEGSKNYLPGSDTIVFEQSVAPGTLVPRGQVIKLTFRDIIKDEEPDYDR